MRELSDIFMDADEKEGAVLGEGYLYRFLKEDSLKRGFCVLTDRRLYFKGRYFHRIGRGYRQSKGEYTIDLKNITGSGYAAARFGALFFLEILFVFLLTLLTALFLVVVDAVEHYHFGNEAIAWGCLILLVLGLAAVPIYYYLKPVRMFVIEYMGGQIAFLTFDFMEEDMKSFQRALYQAKDAIVPVFQQKEDISR